MYEILYLPREGNWRDYVSPIQYRLRLCRGLLLLDSISTFAGALHMYIRRWLQRTRTRTRAREPASLAQVDSIIICTSRRVATAERVAIGVEAKSKPCQRLRDCGAELEMRFKIPQLVDQYQSERNIQRLRAGVFELGRKSACKICMTLHVSATRVMKPRTLSTLEGNWRRL